MNAPAGRIDDAELSAPGLRCIVYVSRATTPWSADALAALAQSAQQRNASRGITGRLLHVADTFVQTLEGPTGEVSGLYRAIAADPRHSDVHLLVDVPLATRAYPHWAMDVVAGDAINADAADLVAEIVPRLVQLAPGEAGFGLEVGQLLQRVGRQFAAINMRATPVQPRAQKTVERILAAGRRLGLGRGSFDVSLQAVADAANVRLGAVYRYFSTPEDMIRMLVRLWVVALYDRYRARLAAQSFASIDAVVDDMVANVERVLANDLFEPGIPQRLKLTLIRDYHDVPYAELWTLAGDIRAAMARGGLDTSDPQGQARLAMAFASCSALIKMMAVHAPKMRGTRYVHDTLHGYFTMALAGSGATATPLADSSDAHPARLV